MCLIGEFRWVIAAGRAKTVMNGRSVAGLAKI
jgi:hypothetical protein